MLILTEIVQRINIVVAEIALQLKMWDMLEYYDSLMLSLEFIINCVIIPIAAKLLLLVLQQKRLDVDHSI